MQFFALLNGRPTIFQGLYLKGTPAAPTIAFADEPGTGFFLYGTSQLGVSAGGDWSLIFAPSGLIYGRQGNNYLQLATSGAITLAAAGTNQSVLLTASGTGAVVFQAANTLFRNQSGASEWARFNNSGKFLVGTSTDSANGAIQLADHTTAAGGIGFGADVSIYRQSAGQLQIEHIGGTNPQLKFATGGTTRGYLRADPVGNTVINGTSTGAFYINFDNGTGGTIFCNGAGGTVGSVSALGISSFTGASHTFGSSASAGTSLKVISGVGTLAAPKYSALDFRTYNDSDSGAYIRTGNRQSDTNEWILEFAARSNGNVLTQVASFGAAGNSFLTLLTTAASATASAGFRIPHGAAPTAPVNGDIWTTTAGLFVRINGATVGPLT